MHRCCMAQKKPNMILPFPAELKWMILGYFDMVVLCQIGAYQRGPTKWRQRLALLSNIQQVKQCLADGFHEEALFLLDCHVTNDGPLNLSPSKMADLYGINTGHDKILDMAVVSGASNKQLVRLLQRGFIGDKALIIAAKQGRFDTVRALHCNDWYGELVLRSEVAETAIERNNIEFIKWCWKYKRSETASDRCCFMDLESWMQCAIRQDAVESFAYLYEHVATCCCTYHSELALEHNSRKILRYLLEAGCASIKGDIFTKYNKYSKRYRLRHRETTDCSICRKREEAYSTLRLMRSFKRDIRSQPEQKKPNPAWVKAHATRLLVNGAMDTTGQVFTGGL